MPMPAHAFAEVYPKALPPGSLFMFRGFWALRVACSAAPGDQYFLMLGGSHIGQLLKIGDGMTSCISVVPPFTWFLSVADGTAPKAMDVIPAALAITTSGPLLIGANPEPDRFAREHHAFHADGMCDPNFDRFGSIMQYVEWTAELQHPTRPFESLGCLFTINRTV